MRICNIVATTTLALLASATLIHPVAAAAARSPGPTIERPGPDTGRTAEPGDPFFPPTTNAPTSNPDIATYPKLTCYFEIVDGQVVIHWFNAGTAAAPVGSMITGTTASGIGVSWSITEPIEPGASVTLTLEMDPAWFNDFCYATVTV